MSGVRTQNWKKPIFKDVDFTYDDIYVILNGEDEDKSLLDVKELVYGQPVAEVLITDYTDWVFIESCWNYQSKNWSCENWANSKNQNEERKNSAETTRY